MKPRGKLLLAVGIGTVLTAWVALRYFVKGTYIHGEAMSPAISDGATLFSLRAMGSLQRGDVVLVEVPPPCPSPIISRLVAIGGDRVEVRGDQIEVNGRAQTVASVANDGQFPHLVDAGSYAVTPAGSPRSERLSLTVPPARVFIAADHRDASCDSRTFGPVPVAAVTHKGFFVVPNR